MSDFITKLSDMIDPEVMGDMVSARIPKKLRVAPFAKIDDTLAGVPGDTITVPAYTYIGDAADVAEGGEVAIEKMTTSTRKATIKKAMKGIGLTDEAVLSGYGNPVGEANTQLALAIAAGLPHSAALRLLTDDTLSFSMALCTLVTHLVYQFILVPDAKRNGKRFADFGASFGNLCVHYLTPLLVVAQWLLLADKSSLGWRSALWWLTLPLAGLPASTPPASTSSTALMMAEEYVASPTRP